MRNITIHFFVFIVVGLFLTNCKQKEKSDLFAENVEIIYENEKDVDSKLLGLKSWVSDEEPFNGHATIKLDKSHKYGLEIKLNNLAPNAFVRVTVWKKGGKSGVLAFTSSSMSVKYQKYSSTIIEHGANGWNKIILETFVPPNYNGEGIKIFVWNPHQTEEAYFSDLKVVVYNRKSYPGYKDVKSIELLIGENVIDYISKNRQKSFRKGMITKKTKKEFDAIAVIDGEEFPISIRIKGDWLDHLQGNKWSFRIKMKEGNFRGMKEFSIQNPGARGFLDEWVIHKIFEDEDVLTTRYGFIPIKINGAGVGIYAYEEHFEKRLIESKKRREGPILKFNEDVMWRIGQINILNKEDTLVGPVVESSMITPFKKKKTMKSELLKQQFTIGQNLLNQYRDDDQLISDLFKTDIFSRFYAIVAIGRIWHPLRWHNERFYYDPIASKLEVIAFDCYTPATGKHNAWLEPDVIYNKTFFNYDKYLSVSPFNDTVFLNHYVKNMYDYLYTDKILKIIQENYDEIKKYEEWIQREYTFYQYDYQFIEQSIDQLKPKLKKLEKKLNKTPLKAELKIAEYNYGDNGVINGLALQAFTESFSEIRVKNFHSKPLFLIGYSSKQRPEQDISYFDKPIKFEAYKNLSEIDRKTISCLYTPDKIYYKENIVDADVHKANVMPWPEPQNNSPRQELLNNALTKSTDYAKVENRVITFNPGDFVFNKPVVIPSGYEVIIRANTHLDFIENAFFMSFSPVDIKGTPTNKVIIESSDGTGMGFTIIEASEQSVFDNVRFKGWNTLNYQGWILTGAITFYESDVSIENTDFLNNNCEDALNIIRADFSLKYSVIANAFADGFDADFTTGVVYDCDFKQIGNDGIDYSGSEIKIENVSIDGAGDKGISGGEGSTLIIKNVVISNSNIGIASKDRSNLTINNIELINCNCGFAAYQKKTEYGPAEMTIIGCEMKNVKDVYMLGLGSVINLEGDVNKGSHKLDIDSLYAK
jgi:hypothetical protein